METMERILFFPLFLFAVMVHEIAHGFVAYLCGDPTAKDRGRLTLNPVKHIDPVMSIGLPLLLLISGSSFIIGGAKPVPFNYSNLKNPNVQIPLISIAGPLSNFILGALGYLIGMACIPIIAKTNMLDPWISFTQYFLLINIFLGLFNLIPIPPLDGSKVLYFFLPKNAQRFMLSVEQYGFIILMVVLFTGGLKYLSGPTYTIANFISEKTIILLDFMNII